MKNFKYLGLKITKNHIQKLKSKVELNNNILDFIKWKPLTDGKLDIKLRNI